MSLFKVGRLCIKLAGRDAGRKCIVVENVDSSFVVVDGDVRRRKVNIKHLEPLADVVEIKDKASHDEVKKAFDKLGLSIWDKKSKKTAERPRKVRGRKKPVEDKKVKKSAKKEEPKEVKETPTEKKGEPVKEETLTAEKVVVKTEVEEKRE